MTVSILSPLPLSCYRRRSHRLPVRHLPHPPPGLPHEEEGRGQLRPGREETLRRRLPEGPDQGVLCIEAGPAPTSSERQKSRVTVEKKEEKKTQSTTANLFKHDKKQVD